MFRRITFVGPGDKKAYNGLLRAAKDLGYTVEASDVVGGDGTKRSAPLVQCLGSLYDYQKEQLVAAGLLQLGDLETRTLYEVWHMLGGRKPDHTYRGHNNNLFAKVCDLMVSEHMRFADNADPRDFELRTSKAWTAAYGVAGRVGGLLARVGIITPQLLAQLTDSDIDEIDGIGLRYRAQIIALRGRVRGEFS